MISSTKDAATTLNGLIKTCRDGEEGFRFAADAAKDSQLRELFRDLSSQRAQFAIELEAEVSRLGETPSTEGTIMGAIHRGWMNVKNAIGATDDYSIVSECERGEDAAIAAYRDALDEDLPASTQSLVARQFSFVQAGHDRVRAIEHAHEQSER
jgi:uncharacterized protein (TIGR02284 family)